MEQIVEQEWKQTACILCECNCGVEVRLAADGKQFERVRGDKAHPGSKGYTCEKALRLTHYQNSGDRILHPLRRRDDGTYEEVDWDTAMSEIAEKFKAVRAEHGGESIFYYGGGGQGNHLGGAYAGATMRALGAKYRSNALAQEKTGEFWVNAKMVGAFVRPDLEHSEVAVFLGKNPWQSHGFPHARTTLKEIAADPARTMIVIDPRRSETADMADFHIQPRPGTDAWLLAAMAGVLVEEGLIARDWLHDNAVGLDEVLTALKAVDIAGYCAVAGVPEETVREVARRIGTASSVGVFEDLGVQMNRHSTVVSYIEKLLWLLTGNFANPGGQYAPSALVSLARHESGASVEVSPVVGARIISGLVPCNVVAEECLADHPRRYRAMLIESANPARSLADSPRMREALSSLELLVVIDVAMTETARLAHYVLPAPTQYEKYEATFFNFDFPRNVFQLRHPVVEAPEGPLVEAEIHARLAEALGVLSPSDLAPLHAAAALGRAAYGVAFLTAVSAKPELAALAPIVLYRTLGPTLPDGAAAAAVLWAAAHRCAMTSPESVRRAGYADGEELFDAILAGKSGVVITDDEYDETWKRARTGDGKVHLAVPEMLEELASLGVAGGGPDWLDDAEFPFILSAGERRSFTANTIIRDPAWRKKDPGGALRLCAADAVALGVADGDRVRVTTRTGSAVAVAEVSDRMRQGHVSLPNGFGLDHPDSSGAVVVTGTAPNELTASADRDPFAGTPWHKSVPARLERV